MQMPPKFLPTILSFLLTTPRLPNVAERLISQMLVISAKLKSLSLPLRLRRNKEIEAENEERELKTLSQAPKLLHSLL